MKEADAGVQVSEIFRKYSITENTFYNWNSKFGGMDVSDVKRLKALEEEHSRLKHLVGQTALKNDGLQNDLS